MCSPDRESDHCVQSSHHDPLCLAAEARHCSGSVWLRLVASYQALGPGGVTMPAMCPPLDSTYQTLPPISLVVWNDPCQGTMWSLIAPTTYVSFLTEASDSRCPASSSSPRASSLRMYRERR